VKIRHSHNNSWVMLVKERVGHLTPRSEGRGQLTRLDVAAARVFCVLYVRRVTSDGKGGPCARVAPTALNSSY
jgi:hypothetical protein